MKIRQTYFAGPPLIFMNFEEEKAFTMDNTKQMVTIGRKVSIQGEAETSSSLITNLSVYALRYKIQHDIPVSQHSELHHDRSLYMEHRSFQFFYHFLF